MTFIFNKQKQEIVLDMPEPDEGDFGMRLGEAYFFDHESYEKSLIVYNSRPRYPVSKELSDSWEDGKKVLEGKDFVLEIDFDAEFDKRTDYGGPVPVYPMIAEPITDIRTVEIKKE